MTDPRTTRRWTTLAKAVTTRDGECAVCGETENLQADHIIPVSLGGAVWDEENLQTLCAKHNRQKSNKVTGQVTDFVNPKWLAFERLKT